MTLWWMLGGGFETPRMRSAHRPRRNVTGQAATDLGARLYDGEGADLIEIMVSTKMTVETAFILMSLAT